MGHLFSTFFFLPFFFLTLLFSRRDLPLDLVFQGSLSGKRVTHQRTSLWTWCFKVRCLHESIVTLFLVVSRCSQIPVCVNHDVDLSAVWPYRLLQRRSLTDCAPVPMERMSRTSRSRCSTGPKRCTSRLVRQLHLPLDFVFQGSMLACAQGSEVAVRCVHRWTDRGDVIAITTRFVV